MPARGIELGLPGKHPSKTTERLMRCCLFGSSRGMQGLSAILEEVGAILPTGFEFHTGKQYTQVQNGTQAVLPANTGCGLTARQRSWTCLEILAAARPRSLDLGCQQHCKYHRVLFLLGSRSWVRSCGKNTAFLESHFREGTAGRL